MPRRLLEGRPMTALWRNWTVHNLVAHPVSEVLHLVGLGSLGDALHDATVPDHEPGTGRG